MAVDLVRAGFPTAAVQNAGRWASDHMPAYYTRGETAARGAVAAFYGRLGRAFEGAPARPAIASINRDSMSFRS